MARLLAEIRRLIADFQSIAARPRSLRSPAAPTSPAKLIETVRAIVRSRKNREKIFSGKLFGEPSWDMLLELFEAELIGRSESVSSLCYASGAAPTTALRHLHSLEKKSWIARYDDPRDQRRKYVTLTEKGRSAMSEFFGQFEVAEGVETSD